MKISNNINLNLNILQFFFLSLIFFIVCPIFIYFYDSEIHLKMCNSLELCAAINFGTIILLIISIYFIIINKSLIIFSSFILLFSLEYFFYNETTLLLRVLKSLFTFIIFFCFIGIRQELNFNKKFLKLILNKFIPYLFIFFQIILIFSNLNFFYALEIDTQGANLFLKVYKCIITYSIFHLV